MKHPHHPGTGYLLMIVFFSSVILIGGCNGTEVGNPDSGSYSVGGDMTGFSDDAELEAYLIDQYAKRAVMPESFEQGDVISDGSSGAPSSGGSNNFTGTNVQEAGVDESDVLKTDGQYIYVARQGTIVIVAASDPLRVVGRVAVEGRVSSLYLYDDVLVGLYTPKSGEGIFWDEATLAVDGFFGFPYWIPMQAATGIALFDISDPAAPALIRTIEVDGRLVSSRRIDNRLFVVQQFLPDIPYPCGQYCVQDMQLRELVPFYRLFDAAGNPLPDQQLVGHRNFFRPGIDSGGSIVSVLTFDLDQPEADFKSLGVVADAEVVYASTEALYLTATRWDYDRSWGDEWYEQTLILKYDLTQEDVVGCGYRSVKGRILNQFSLGEHAGTLRIATTTWFSSENHVFCLQSQEDNLRVVGKLENIAPGEQLYAARFTGERGFLVTFLMVDPLFTLDLSDPTSPKVIGELKVPGYSNYIHPWGADHLITIGKDTSLEDGWPYYQGVQLSLFDISDFANPQLLSSTVLGTRGTHSEALFNHKAFTFRSDDGLLAFPLDLYEHDTPPSGPWSYGSLTFSGLYVYRIDSGTGFSFLGRINTAGGAPQTGYSSAWTRGLFMDDNVYAVIPEAVFTAETDNIEETTTVISIESE